jgi:hypothetical protein
LKRGTLARRRTAAPLSLILCALPAVVSGCAFPLDAEMDRASRAAHYAIHFDHVTGPENNLLDRALAECPEKLLKAEQTCVRQAIDGSGLSPRALAALVPQCKAAQLCHYDHVTQNRIGPIEATSTNFKKHWRIDLDFRQPATDVSHVPATVIDLDDFGSTTPG